MVASKLEINLNIEIQVKRGPYKGDYQSRIADIEDDYLKLLVPFRKGSLVPLSPGTEIAVFFSADTAAYKFSTEIQDRVSESVPLLVVDRPAEDDFVKIQRRKFFRLEVRKKIWYRPVDKELEPEDDYKESWTIDISGGGVKMVLEEELEKEQLLEVKLDIEAIEGVPILAKIVNFYDIADGKACGMKFVDINPRTRDSLMGWLFDHQRKLRRKGLI